MPTSAYTRAAVCALAALWLAQPLPAIAQEEPAAETPQPKPPPPEPSIPVAEIPGSATAAEAELKKIEQRATPVDDIEEIRESLPEKLKGLEGRLNVLAEKLERTHRIEQIVQIEADWLEIQRGLKGRADSLTERAQELEEALAKLDEIETMWKRTKADAEEADAPKAIRDRVRSTLRALEGARAAVSKRRDRILELLDEEAKLLELVAAALEDIGDKKDLARSGLFQQVDPPIWQALADVTVDPEEQQRALDAVREDYARALVHIDSRRAEYGLHLALLISILAGLVALRRRAAEWPEDDADLDATRFVVSRPVSSAIVLALSLSPFVHPQPPVFIARVEGLAIALSVLRLIPGLLDKTGRTVFYGLLGFYAADRIRGLLLVLPPVERLLFELEILAVLVIIVMLLRPGRTLRLEDPPPAWLVPVGVMLRMAVILLGVAWLASVLGYAPLARYLADGVLRTGYAAVPLVLAYHVVASLVHVLCRSNILSRLNTVSRHRDLVESRAITALRWLSVVAWIFFVLEAFDIRREVLEGVAAALAAELQVGELSVSLGGVFSLVIAVIVTVYLSRFVRFVLDEDVTPRMRLPRGVPYAISATAQYTILVVGFLLAIAAGGVDLTKFTILAGALGVGVGFGLQNVVNNFVSGIILLFERPVQTGDVIQVVDLLGRVTRIGIRSSSVRTFDGAEVIVPNANLISDQVVNWTLSDRTRRIDVPVGVAYGTDPTVVLDLLLEVGKQNDRVLQHPAPMAYFFGFGESSLDFMLRAWTREFDDWVEVRSDLNVAVNAAIVNAGIEIPFPQRDLHVRSVDADVSEAIQSKSGD